MQQPVSRRDVYSPSLSARIGGQDVELVSASVDRALPDPVVGGTLTAASVEFTAVEGADVASKVATPWDPASSWPPAPEAPVSVSMDTGAGPVSVLTGGRVVSASGGTGGREVTVEAADLYQSLDKTISWDAVAAHMPSLEEAEHGRYVSMLTSSVTDQILRHCGWYSTPPRINYTMLSVPAQGSMWPERGVVESSNRRDEGGYPSWGNASWGVGVTDVSATYSLFGGGYTVQGRGGLEMCAMTQTAGLSDSMYVMARSADWSARFQLWWSDSSARIRFLNAAGEYEDAVTVPRSDGLLYATIEYVDATTLAFTLRSGGRVVTATLTVPATLSTAPLTVGQIYGRGRAAGFQVAAPNGLGTLTAWSPNAVIYARPVSKNNLAVLPPVEGENCADLLAAQCKAEAATYWIDETGVLRWWDLGRLESQGSVATLHSEDDIAEAGFAWSHDLSSVKSRVSVKWKQPLAARSWRTSIDLYQGRGETLQPGDVIEGWISVPDDEVWIMPDLSLSRVGDSYSDFNYGIASWYGGVVDRGDGTDTWAQLHGSLLMTVERVTDRAFKTWVQWTGDRVATLRTLDKDGSQGTGMWARRRDFDLPIIRGKLKFKVTDRLTYSSQTGPQAAPEHEIDVGWWIQSEAQAQYTADYAGQRLTVPQPVLSSIALIPVPGLQLGDMVAVRDTHVTRLTVRGVVVEDSRSIGADMAVSHSVAIRPVAVSRNGVTWQEWASVIRPSTWAGWATSEGGTWQQWGTNPLNN